MEQLQTRGTHFDLATQRSGELPAVPASVAI